MVGMSMSGMDAAGARPTGLIRCKISHGGAIRDDARRDGVLPVDRVARLHFMACRTCSGLESAKLSARIDSWSLRPDNTTR